jgi:hypothetical protein
MLRTLEELHDCTIGADDGVIGHVKDLFLDDEDWAVRYLIADTSNWWLGHQMLVAPQWIESVSWRERKVSVELTRQAVKDAPVYDPTGTLTREDEARVYEHHGRNGYWTTEGKPVIEATHV